MTKKKTTPKEEIKNTIQEEETIEETTEEEVETYIPESEAKQEFRMLIQKYAAQNPVKYAQKKEKLEQKLNSMK
jgi:hypothetical protein